MRSTSLSTPRAGVRVLAALTVTATGLTLAACSSDEDPVASAPPPTAPSSTSSAPSPTSAAGTAPSSTTSAALTDAPVGNGGPAPALVGTFSMTGPARIDYATYDSMPYVLPLNPAGPQDTMVRWVEGWGQSPATAEQGTTYVLGHAWGQQKLVFNPISETVTANVDFNSPTTVAGDEGVHVEHFPTDVLNGSLVRMQSPDGGLREWVIDTAYLVDKNTAAYDTNLIDTSKPGRLVLIACSVDGTTDLGYNVIVEGHLT